MTATVNLPVTYSLKGIPLGKKAFKEQVYAEFVTVDVPHVHPDDAPLAFSWNVPDIPASDVRFDYMAHFEVGAYGDDRRNHTLFHGGRHWMRLLRSHLRHGHSSRGRWGNGDAVTDDEFLTSAHEGIFGRLFGFHRSHWTVPPVPHGEDVTARYLTVRENERPRSMRALERLSLISVNGILHMACDQPMIALPSADYESRRYNLPYVTARYRALSDNPSAAETRFLPFSMTEEINKSSGDMPAVIARTDHGLQVHLQEAFSPDAEIEVNADYHVSLTFSASHRARTTVYPDLYGYFGLPDLDAKAAFLEEARRQWPQGGVSPKLLDEALAILDERSIEVSLETGTQVPTHL